MTSQTENSTACDTACTREWIPWNDLYRYPYEQAISREEKHKREYNQIQEQFRVLKTSIDAVERIYNREIAILYRLIEERTLILSDVDEIYNDYC